MRCICERKQTYLHTGHKREEDPTARIVGHRDLMESQNTAVGGKQGGAAGSRLNTNNSPNSGDGNL